MVNSTDGFNAAPAPEAAHSFFAAIFADQKTQGRPLSGYEVDFLQDQTAWFEYMVTQHDGAARWLSGMANAAHEANVSVQYCMAHPAAFLHALTLPAVTNGRASGDYQNPAGNLLSYGSAAPFFAAVGIAPSKDNWWSTERQPKPRDLGPTGPPPCDGGSRNVTNSFLHALVATLSTGPVGFSDALGYTNASLVNRTCDSSGLLLKPSLPLAAIDRSFSRARGRGRALPAMAHVWYVADGGCVGGLEKWEGYGLGCARHRKILVHCLLHVPVSCSHFRSPHTIFSQGNTHLGLQPRVVLCAQPRREWRAISRASKSQ